MRRRRPPELKRRAAVREPKRRFIIFTEGRNTEPAYFRALAAACSSALIDIIVVGAAGVPYTIAERASRRAIEVGISPGARRKRDSFEEHDEIWAVFDRDTHPRIDEAVRLCERSRVGIARSNPCFELWLILHEADYDKPDSSKLVQAHLRAIRPEYDPSSRKLPDCIAMVARIETAEQRAETQLARRATEGSPYGSPSTTVFLLRAIRTAAFALG